MALEGRVAALVSSGDRAGAAAEVIRAVGPPVARYLRALLGDGDDAADAFSIFAERVWTGIETFRAQSTVRAWAFGVASNAARRVRASAWRRRRTRLATDAASALAQEVWTSSAERREHRAAALERLRGELAPEDRDLVLLRTAERLSWEAIAAAWSADGRAVTAAALRKRYERLKRRLASRLRAAGLADA